MSEQWAVHNADCLEILPTIKDKSIDLILTDPPYGTTACKWDSVIPFEPMWKELKRITKDNGCIALFGSEPFSSHLRLSNLSWFKYDCIWVKSKVSGFTNAKNKPLNTTELISFFSNGVTANTKKKCNKMSYYPQGLIRVDKTVCNTNRKFDSTIGNRKSRKGFYIQKYTNYPKNLLEFYSVSKTVHPTQKPVALLEYLIKTYTKENETVLDFTMGSGSTGVACKHLNRNFIGIEKDEKYFKIAKERINCSDNIYQQNLF